MTKTFFYIFIVITYITFIQAFLTRATNDELEKAMIIDTEIDISTFIETFKITIGTPIKSNPENYNQTFKFAFNLKNFSWVNGPNCKNSFPGVKYYDPRISSSSNNDNRNLNITVHNNQTISGSIYYDNFYSYSNVSNIQSNYNLFLVAETCSEMIDGEIAFPYTIDKDSLYLNSSIFDQMINQNFTTKIHRVVSHQFNESTGKGRYFLGAYPNEITNGNLSFTKCKANYDWMCTLSHLKFGDLEKLSDASKLENNNLAIFVNSIPGIIAPYEHLKIFKNSYFNGSCNFNLTTEKFICNEEFVNKSQKIIFVFDDVAYNLSDSLFTTKDNISYNFIISFSNTTKFWKFGTKFLKNYITVFDGDFGKIGFYGANIHDFNYSSVTLIFIIAVGTLIIVLAAILIFYCFRKKSEEGLLLEKDK